MFQRLSVLFFMIFTAATLLTACGSSSSSPWTRPTTQAPASEAPGSLDARGQWLNTDPQTGVQTDALLNQPGDSTGTFTPPPAAIPMQNLPPVKVALLVPLSGQGKEVGEAIMNAAQLALFDVGYDAFELMPRDTHGTAQGASAAAESAARDGAQLILGPLFADEVRAVKSVANRYNLNVIGFSTDWKLAGGNTFLMGFMPFGQVQRVVDYAATRGIRNVGVMIPDSEYGQMVYSAFQNRAPVVGMQMTSSMRFTPGDKNMTDAVKQFSQYDLRHTSGAPAPFEAVMIPAGGTDARALANLLTYFDMPPQQVRRIGTGLWDDVTLASDKNLQGAWFAAPEPSALYTFNTKYRNAYGITPPRVATLGYDAAALAVVLARNGHMTQGAPAFDWNSIMNPNGFAGLDGIFRFRPDGLVDRGLAVLEYRNGQIVVVDPAPKTFQSPIQQSSVIQ
ncbi:penicillin-binding protein activator [Micavibrio aeruginosavorus]|uniref:Extracellular ligand-binding receptor n=1 Tax=Micavibrio aeruginosavorus EPB TaxID=349215 RepID=M4VD48_9BACT|nr:penicillin-binding protein activator [Micavibrio aeruginosavorus]AGH97322.1 extracellular ligand-binding receptor [Micavibrio aeruginosavorus EPB]